MPPTGRFLLDTNILIALFASDRTVLRAIRSAHAVYVPVVALGELYYGARKSGRATHNLERVSALAGSAPVLACDATTAERYGELKAALRARGPPIPENDLWVAAIARQHHLTLATRDLHFSTVDGLTVDRW
jgi:tRNA(fMet)-specific endonuclease VapC